MAAERFSVEVVLALRDLSIIRSVEVTPGDRVMDAVAAAELPRAWRAQEYAIYGERVDAGRALRPGDRIDVVRPLEADPREARRRRAALRERRDSVQRRR